MTREEAGLEGPVRARADEAVRMQERIFKDSFPGALGVKILEARQGFARGTIEVDHRVRHPGGYAHGGALAGFGDTIAAWATFPSLGDGEIFATIEFKANFLTAVTGGTLVGEGTVVHRGGRTIVVEVRVTTEEAEPRLVCLMLVTQAILRPGSPEQPSLY